MNSSSQFALWCQYLSNMGCHVETITDGKVPTIHVSVKKYQKMLKKIQWTRASIKEDLKQTGSNVQQTAVHITAKKLWQ